ncbi:MAG: hypothetical protein ABFR65_05910 [Pseudomonadota bacterium]
MDVTVLTTLIAPALPYLVKGGEKLAEMTAEKIGGAAPELIKRIWERLRGAVDKSPAAKEIVADLAESPDDEGYQVAFQSQLKKILEKDEDLARQLAELLQEAKQQTNYHAELHGNGAIAQGENAVAAGKGGVAVGGDVHGGISIGGKSDKD